ncbi:tryptophan-rich sensory protein [Roseovarius spongiae]|uniref:Tryptophan-rich sensory protein n=1 Tax=Roseovarius spongiae TaxID=2320272 RepID=A0A3A8AY51_9RHOB|nr:TspO/MBR family protein [Roseovarius spongiae]RKF15131.1 tryptophan-rich sensory protein [Roseovarius spongiae]
MDWTLFFIFLITCGAAGAGGALFPPGDWYARLTKPDWTPPDWAFPVAWSAIYLLISFAGARAGATQGGGLALAFWAMQAGFSTLWTPLFFGLRRMRAALFVLCILWLAVLGALIAHFRVDFWAGLAFLPYLGWLSLAGALNLAVIRLNPREAALHPHRM